MHLINILISVLMAYLLFGFYLFLTQKSMIYYPDDQDFNDCIGFSDYEKMKHNGTRFYMLEQSEDVVIYYHGNAGSACDRAFLKNVFEESGNTVIFVEYAGYSGDEAVPSINNILNDVRNIHNYITTRSKGQVTIYGQSVGSGAASYHASLGGVDRIILVTPFSTMKNLAQSKYRIYPASIMVTEDYDNIAWLRDYDGKLLIIHGDSDYVIPHRFSSSLYMAVPVELKRYVLIPGAGHNDIWNHDKMVETVSDFLE